MLTPSPIVTTPGTSGTGSATRVVASTAGLLAAAAGVEHAIGELRQGATPIQTVVFESWPDEPAFAVLSGEPAMSLLPTYLWSGAATTVVSLVIGVWAVGFVHRPRGGLVLLLLSVVLLLVGGGFGPPLLGILAGITGMRIGATGRAPGRVLHTLAPAWPWLLGLAVAGFVALVPVAPLLSLTGVDALPLVSVVAPLAFPLMVLAALAARGHDRSEQARSPAET